MQGKHLSHVLHGHAVPALKQGKRRRWRWAAVSIASVLAIMFVYTYIYCLASIVFNYAWWILFSSTVQSAHPSRATAMEGQALVPKIIHQTWRNETIPEKWSKASVACQQLHPGYEYMMWTDAKAEQLIRDKYPWFLDTYLAYSYNIQRADALRYFVLHEYGEHGDCPQGSEGLVGWSNMCTISTPRGSSSRGLCQEQSASAKDT